MLGHELETGILAVRQQLAGLDVVMKRHVQEVFDKDFPQVRRLDRKQEFHAPVQVTGHEVSAAEKQFFLPAIAKIIEPCVFQEPSDDRGHGDGFTDAGNPRAKPRRPPEPEDRL